MRLRLNLLIWLLVCATALVAQDSLRIHPDTIRLQDMPSATDYDVEQMLLDLVAEQGRQLHEQAIQQAVDSGAVLDSLPTLTVGEVLRRDSIARAEQRRQDSIRAAFVHDSLLLDSLVRMHETLEEMQIEVPVTVARRALVKDRTEDEEDVIREKRNLNTRWRKDATVMLQVTQNYVTDNWYQGGNSSFAMLGIAKGQIGYYGDKFTWENTGELREGHSTVHGDSLRKINTTDDLLRLYTKAGYRVFEQLFVSFSGEYEMHFSPIYKPNTTERKSGFASPMRLNLAFGLDYKPVKGLSVAISPLAYKMVYVHDTVHINQKDFGVPTGQRVLNDAGSSVRVEYLWRPLRELSLETRFYMYTNYKTVELDLEVNCDFIINRFFSTRVTLHPRFDNSVILPEGEKHKMQFKELISVGFAHKFY